MGGGHPEHDDGIEAAVKQLIERGLKNNTKNIRVWSMKYQPTSFWSWTVLFIDFLMKIIHKPNILMGS